MKKKPPPRGLVRDGGKWVLVYFILQGFFWIPGRGGEDGSIDLFFTPITDLGPAHE